MLGRFQDLLIGTILLLLVIAFKGNAIELSKSGDPENHITEDKVKSLGDLCWSLREKSSDSALLIGKKALYFADSLELYSEYARISNYVGVVYMHYLKDAKSGIPYYHRALEACLKAGDTIQIAYSYNNLGDAFYLIGSIPLAIEYGELSLEYFNKLGNQRGIAYSYINLGLAYRSDKQFEKSVQYFEQAIEIREKLDDRIGIASATYEIALAYLGMNNLKKAYKYFEKALQLNKEIDNKMYMALSLNGIGDVLFMKGDYHKALGKFKESLKYNIEGNHLAGIVHNKLGIALVYSKLTKRNEGEEQLREALEISKKLGLSSNILETYHTYAMFFNNIGDYKASIESYNDYLQIYDSLYSVQQFEALTEMQNRLQLSLSLNEIAQDLETKKRETIYYIIIISLFIILIVVLFWRYKASKRLSKQLKLVNESKDKLFSIISHDLKAPFNSILGFSELLLKEVKKEDNEKINKYSDFINKVSNQSVDLIDNITSWSRAQRGVIKIFRSTFNLYELVTEVITIHSAVAKQKRIRLEVDVDSKLNMNADKDIIRTILTNLISNALKFTQQQGMVKIVAEEQSSKIVIRVIDSGVGIESEDIDKLFTIKDNYSTRGTDDEKGTGLGLIICKDFAELHGGSVSVESKIGEGSTFIITIPK